MSPSTIAKGVPAWLAPWLIRLGVWLQEIGRECYYQCPNDKQRTINDKLEQVYGPLKT